MQTQLMTSKEAVIQIADQIIEKNPNRICLTGGKFGLQLLYEMSLSHFSPSNESGTRSVSPITPNVMPPRSMILYGLKMGSSVSGSSRFADMNGIDVLLISSFSCVYPEAKS